jgi:hypothetical protein
VVSFFCLFRAPPHPYFVNKILVFLRLQAGLRCKIVKTKEFPAKIVQDKELRGVSASGNLFGLKNGAKRMCRDNDLQEEFLVW